MAKGLPCEGMEELISQGAYLRVHLNGVVRVVRVGREEREICAGIFPLVCGNIGSGEGVGDGGRLCRHMFALFRD